MNDHELTVLVEAAAKGVADTAAEVRGSLPWDQLNGDQKNQVREMALPFIYHAMKALPEPDYTKPRQITTVEELEALPHAVVIRENRHGIVWEKQGDGEGGVFWVETGDEEEYQSSNIELPATVLYKGWTPGETAR